MVIPRMLSPAMKKRASNPNAPFSLGKIAHCLVLERKRKAMSRKSRPFSNRALRQWALSQRPEGMLAQIDAMVFNTACRAKLVCADPKWLPALVYAYLVSDLVSELHPRRGRKPLGIIGRAMRPQTRSARWRGRPPLVAPLKEREWLASIYGLKAGLQSTTEGNVEQASAFLRRYERLGTKVLLEELDDAITDSKVATIEVVRSTLPGSSSEAITRRLRRARKTFTLDFYEKSGG